MKLEEERFNGTNDQLDYQIPSQSISWTQLKIIALGLLIWSCGTGRWPQF